MGSFIKKKIFYQTLAFILPFVVVAIFFTSAILSLTNHRFFQKTILQDYSNIARSTARGIAQYLENARTNIENLSMTMASLGLDSWQKNIFLTAFLHQNPQFSDIGLISPRGDPRVPAVFLPPEPHPDLIYRALAGRTVVSIAEEKKQTLPHMDIAVPIFRMRQVDQILLARMSLKFIWEILEDIRIGEKGQIYVMDGFGRIIAHRQIHRVLQPSGINDLTVLTAIRENAGPVQWADESDDGEIYNIGIYIPDSDWIVVLTQPQREVYGYFYQNNYWIALISLFIAVSAVFWGWRGSRRLLAPIHALHHQVRHIGRGDLDRKVAVDREDEIGELGNAFNEMTDSLKHYVERERETARTLAHSKNLAVLGTVASKVSHEMGNFLFGIQMMYNGLKKESLSPNGQHILKNIDAAVAQTSTFIKDFMNFARKPALNFTWRTLDGLIRQALEVLGPEAEGRGIVFTLNWDPAIPPVRMDAGLMNQVFINLVKNGMEAMAGPGKITVSGKAAGENLLVSVMDTGPGMDAETLSRLFEPFFTTKGVLGNGLGLAIVKSNIEAHGGTIECISAPGKGSEFFIRLPLDQQA